MQCLIFLLIWFYIRERDMKVAARNEALQLAADELQKRIEQKVYSLVIIFLFICC